MNPGGTIEEALQLGRAQGDRIETATALHHLGLLALEETFDTRAWPSHRREHDGWMQRAQAALEESI